MAFSETIISVIEFYKDFNEVFTGIDKTYEKIDDNGGVNDELLHEIVISLDNYIDTLCADILQQKPEGQEDIEFYKGLREKIEKLQSAGKPDVFVLFNCVNELRDQVHNYMIKDSDWPGQQQCLKILKQILSVLLANSRATNPDLDIIKCYAIVHILRELVADCAISIFGLKPLSEWGYETSAYSRLEAEEQFVVLINQAILTDRMYFCFQSLKIILSRLNKLISHFLKLSWEVYYVVGFLNFKVHKYEDALYCFENVIKQKRASDFQGDIRGKRLFFHSVLLRAYCYEYSGNFSKAIEIIAINTKDIEDILKEYDLISIEQKYVDIMEAICRKAKNEEFSLLKFYMPKYERFLSLTNMEREKSDSENLSTDIMYEILHIFAHCLNEYGIDQKNKKEMSSLTQNTSETEEWTDSGKFIQLSRCMMRSISEKKCDYWICYATIHGEFQDYYKATRELDVAKTKYKENHGDIQKETYSAEISFFKYYFTLLYNRPSKLDKQAFEEYYQKYDDDDAKCHLKIFEFRYELRKYINNLARLIKDSDRDELNDIIESGDIVSLFSQDTIIDIPQSLIELYNDICNLEPTLYMNVKVRIELRALQRAYMCVKLLREYLLIPSEENLLKLNNACSRFVMLQKENNNNVESIVFGDDISTDFVCKSFKDGQFGIFDSLFRNKNLFLLAPVSGSVVFTYQTGNIESLYNTNSILPDTKSVNDIESITNLPWDIIEPYSEYFRKSQPRVLTNIDWNRLKEFTNKIYFWQSDLSNQLLIYEYDNKSNKASCYSRPLLEPEKFSNILSSVRLEIKVRAKRKLYKYCTIDDHDYCRLIQIPNICMEYIDADSLIFICNTHHKLNEETYEEWIIVPEEKIKRKDYHSFHGLLWNVHPKFEEFIGEETEDPSCLQAEALNEDGAEKNGELSTNAGIVSEEGVDELRELLFEIAGPLQNALAHYGAPARRQDKKSDLLAQGVKIKYQKLKNLNKVRTKIVEYVEKKPHTLDETDKYIKVLEQAREEIDSII